MCDPVADPGAVQGSDEAGHPGDPVDAALGGLGLGRDDERRRRPDGAAADDGGPGGACGRPRGRQPLQAGRARRHPGRRRRGLRRLLAALLHPLPGHAVHTRRAARAPHARTHLAR